MAYNSPPLSGRKELRKGFGDNENTRVATGQCSWLVFTALGHLMQNSSADLSSAFGEAGNNNLVSSCKAVLALSN